MKLIFVAFAVSRKKPVTSRFARRAMTGGDGPPAAAVYDRARVTVVLALYAGSGWSQAYARALITARSQPTTGIRNPVTNRA